MQIIINYAQFLQENKYFEESFKVIVQLDTMQSALDVNVDDRYTNAVSSSLHIRLPSRSGTHIWQNLSSALCVIFSVSRGHFAHYLRQGGSKIERARDLFEQALEKCPAKYSKPLYLMYGELEEEHGLAKRAMSIYERATNAVSDDDKFSVRREAELLTNGPDRIVHRCLRYTLRRRQ